MRDVLKDNIGFTAVKHSMLGKSSLPFHIHDETFELAFYLLTLVGLLVGWAPGEGSPVAS